VRGRRKSDRNRRGPNKFKGEERRYRSRGIGRKIELINSRNPYDMRGEKKKGWPLQKDRTQRGRRGVG